MSVYTCRVLRRTRCNTKIAKYNILSSPYYSVTPRLNTLSPRLHHCDIKDNSVDPRMRDYAYNWREHNKPKMGPSTDFDPSNTAQAFQSFTTYQLIKYNLMFGMLGYESLTDTMIKIMNKAMGINTSKKQDQTEQTEKSNTVSIGDLPGMDVVKAILGITGNILSKPLIFVVRKQYFPLFTGGENISRCIDLAKRYYDNGICLTIDSSTEEGHTHDIFEHNLSLKKELVNVSRNKLPPRTVVYMSIKMTSLSSPTLLEQMTSILNREEPNDRDPTPFMNDEEMKELEYTLSNLTEICEYAKDKGIGVWLDAEQYSRQPAMNYLSRRLMKIINTDPDRIWLYNTYQCYLKDANDWMSFDIDHASYNGYTCGVKLVRGAYMDYEAKVATKENKDIPIHDNKETTDKCYDESVEYVLNKIVSSYGSVGIAICSHNRQSLQNATKIMKELGIERDDKYVFMAQLNGMVDNLTYSLGYNGYNALKLMPYGSFQDVWPYLMRRFEENSQILNGTQQERSLYQIEIKRRLYSFIGR